MKEAKLQKEVKTLRNWKNKGGSFGESLCPIQKESSG